MDPVSGGRPVAWLLEPEAAARACGVREGLGLVVDIGGGTSDFSVFRAEGGRLTVLASEGVRIGGTDADRALSLAHVMPLLGMGSRLRAEIGGALTEAPVAPFHDLSTWDRIGFLQTPEMVRDAARMRRLAERPERLARLHAVLESELGFDVAFAVEAGKIAANGGGGRIDLAVLERGLGVALEPERLGADLASFAEAVAEGARRTVERAGLAPAEITHVVHVGGSSLLRPVREALAWLFSQARPVDTAAFTAVAEGLAIAAGERG
jgi:hypothetical chaperone protein